MSDARVGPYDDKAWIVTPQAWPRRVRSGRENSMAIDNKGGVSRPNNLSGLTPVKDEEQSEAMTSNNESPSGDLTTVVAADHVVRSGSHDMQSFIGRQLRAVFDDVAKQPVPDRFLELMKQLEAKTTSP